MTEHEILLTIQEWLFYWMSDEQNPEREQGSYRRRALGVDANMRHHLASMLHEKVNTLPRYSEEKCLDKFVVIDDFKLPLREIKKEAQDSAQRRAELHNWKDVYVQLIHVDDKEKAYSFVLMGKEPLV